MAAEERKGVRSSPIFVVFMGSLYLLFGSLQFAFGLVGLDVPMVAGDVVGGLILILFSAVFFAGFGAGFGKRGDEAISYTRVGVWLGAAFGVIYLVFMGANTLSWILGMDGFENYLFARDAAPAIYLAIPCYVAMLAWERNGGGAGAGKNGEQEISNEETSKGGR